MTRSQPITAHLGVHGHVLRGEDPGARGQGGAGGHQVARNIVDGHLDEVLELAADQRQEDDPVLGHLEVGRVLQVGDLPLVPHPPLLPVKVHDEGLVAAPVSHHHLLARVGQAPGSLLTDFRLYLQVLRKIKGK